jgi:hypothetical protein
MKKEKPIIGVLAWDSGSSDTLSQLESMPGNMLHPNTFDFDLKIARVKGADYKSIVECPDITILNNMIVTARILEKAGVRAITTSCGFNAIFQKDLAAAVEIPVFASSLIQIPMVYCSLKPGQAVGVITADKQHLTKAHFANSGIPGSIPIKVASISEVGEFAKLRDNPTAILDPDLFISQVATVAEVWGSKNPEIGAIVLECTDLPPCASAIRSATGLAVFDIVTLLKMVHDAITLVEIRG